MKIQENDNQKSVVDELAGIAAVPQNEDRNFAPGDIVKYFRHYSLSAKDIIANKYIYQIISIAEHADTGEK